jgi:5,6-dimethylbenzimidazole synthase
MWLAARTEGLGLGWVSLFDPDALARLLAMPEGSRPLAVLCIGEVQEFYPRPMLEQEGWTRGGAIEQLVFENRWDQAGWPENQIQEQR